MKRALILAFIIISGTAFAQAPPLKTSDVGIDANGTCWVRGPANVLTQVAPKLGTPQSVVATTVLAKGVWIVVGAGTAVVVVSDGTTVAGTSGSAYPVG